MIALFMMIAMLGQGVTGGAATGTIGGIVIKGTTPAQQSLPNARLELSEGPGTPVIARSDGNGRFLFSNLQPGKYRLFVTKDRFLRADTKIVLARGQQVRDIVFRLEAAPTVTGRVLDDYGEPVANVLVQALKRSYDVRGTPTMTPVAAALTDDLGVYRIYWVDPGEYFLFAGTAQQPGDNDKEISGVAPTYFPGVSDPVDAKPVRVDIGRDASGTDFRLRRIWLTNVSGYLTNSATLKPVGATITLTPPTLDPSWSLYRGQSRSSGPHTGEFSISRGVNPGSYIAIAKSSSGDISGFSKISIRAVPFPTFGAPPPLPAPPRYDLRMALTPPINIEGQFFIDSSLDSTAASDIRRAKVTLTSIDAGLPSPRPGSTFADGKFSVTGATTGMFMVGVSDLPGDLYLKAARFDRTDVLEDMLNIARQPTVPLQILLGADGGRLQAAVFDRMDRPVPSIEVVLIPDISRRHRPDQYRVCASDEMGHVTFRGIPPGEYKVFAWENLEPHSYLNADFMRVYDDLGVTIRIAPGLNNPVSIRSIPSPF